MGLLDINLNDRAELKLLPDNTEARLAISRVEETPNRKDPSRSNLAVTFTIPSEPLVDDIRIWIPIPTPEQREAYPKAHAKAMMRLEEFLNSFRIQLPCEYDDMQGKEGWAIIGEGTDQNGNPQNQVRRFLPPRR